MVCFLVIHTKNKPMEIYIGCSGFYYADWKDEFYPKDLPKDRRLSYYAEHFNSVEINNTFYKFPTEDQLSKWVDETPPHFRFSIKAHRFFTHMKKLNADASVQENLDKFQNILDALEDKLGCVLWQLPGNLQKDISKLESFFNMVEKKTHHVVEMRHDSWFKEPVYEKLRDLGVTNCMLSAPNGLPEDIISTSRTAYLRFHGKSTWYNYLYSYQELEIWRDRLEKLEDVDQIFIYFNNDQNAYAVKNAKTLSEMLNVEV